MVTIRGYDDGWYLTQTDAFSLAKTGNTVAWDAIVKLRRDSGEERILTQMVRGELQ